MRNLPRNRLRGQYYGRFRAGGKRKLVCPQTNVFAVAKGRIRGEAAKLNGSGAPGSRASRNTISGITPRQPLPGWFYWPNLAEPEISPIPSLDFLPAKPTDLTRPAEKAGLVDHVNQGAVHHGHEFEPVGTIERHLMRTNALEMLRHSERLDSSVQVSQCETRSAEPNGRRRAIG